MQADSGAKLRILLVDDSDLFRAILQQYLQPLGEQFHNARDGHEALELIASVGVDVMVADLQMPGMGGIELVRRLRASPRTESRLLPAVLITAERDEATLKEARRVGADELVLKPVRPGALRETVARLARPAR